VPHLLGIYRTKAASVPFGWLDSLGLPERWSWPPKWNDDPSRYSSSRTGCCLSPPIFATAYLAATAAWRACCERAARSATSAKHRGNSSLHLIHYAGSFSTLSYHELIRARISSGASPFSSSTAHIASRRGTNLLGV
jgi:hypothetical protein